MTEALSPLYRHRPKDAACGSALMVAGALVKWYDLDEPAQRITADTRRLAEATVFASANALSNDVAGFAILHQCSATFAFLLISTWRGNNELWQSVRYIDDALTEFGPFTPAYPIVGATARPTFCVWEFGIVAHEALAWQRFLASDRSAQSLQHWQTDCLNGCV